MRTNPRLAQLWLDALARELGAAAGTIATYTDDLNCYLAWVGDRSLGLDDVSLEHVRDYIADLDQRSYAGSTIARRITVIRNLHRFMIAEELGSGDPTSTMSAMKRPRELPFVLSIAETEALLESVRDALCLRHAHQRGAVTALRCRSSWHPHADGPWQGRQAAARAAS